MAKVRLGVLAGQASGSTGAVVYSHNRGGPYTRLRAVPVKVTSDAATDAKNRLATYSAQWGGLTDAEQAAWESWCETHPFTDRLGDKRMMTGHQAYIRVNARLDRAGDSQLSLPPVGDAPDAFSSLTVACDCTEETLNVTFSALDTGMRAWIYLGKVSSGGVSYVENLLRLISVTNADANSPYDAWSDFVARLGTPQAGEYIHCRAYQFDGSSGLLSGPRRADCTAT